MPIRWSEKEDNHILELLNEYSKMCSINEINYEEMLYNHNKLFNTERTDDTYKARIKKIIKENNIEIKTNNRWTEKDINYLIQAVQKDVYEIKWNEISEYLKRSETCIRNKYNELISAEEHLQSFLDNITLDNIQKITKQYEHQCTNCSKKCYSNIFIWDDIEYCEECFNELYSNHIEYRWDKVREYSIINNKYSCNICKKEAIFDNSITNRFHYDHIDMFDKGESICKMVRTGYLLEDIYKEIDKCQLLCLSCHTIITKIEHSSGFIRIKTNITKEFNKTNDKNKKEELNKYYSETYNKFMKNIYNIVKTIT